MYRFLLYSFLLLFVHSNAHASHIVGGEMYYDYLGNNQYRVYIAIYRDCASTGAPFDDPLSMGVFNSSNVLVSQVNIPFPGSTILPVVFNNPCVTPPSGICIERAIYTTIITLPPTPGGYTLSYQRCCRGPNITNLANPDDTGLTLTTHITGSDSGALVNSAPRFTNYPPLVICNNEDLNFNHSATDPDGDSLVYELATPFAGASSLNPAPSPPPAPPYFPVSWDAGFSSNVPLGPGSTTTINPVTGHLFVDANALGLYVVGIRVKEYRNGVLINTTTRDFLFRVVNCVVQLQANITPQEQTPGFISYCQGLTFTFDNQSFGGQSYYWDFGVPGITTDVSTAFEPTYTFPQSGIYNVMLVVNPGWPCTDTAFMTLNINNPLQVDFTYTDSLCIFNNSVDFQAQVNGPAGTVLQWNFGPNASIPGASTPTVNGVHFSASGNNYVTLIGNFNVCSDTTVHPVYILTEPVAGFNLPTNHECLGLTQSFDNTSSGALVYSWDFGDPSTTTDVSDLFEPSYTFPSSGTYTITLIAESAPGCSDTIAHAFTVYEPLDVSFTHNDSLCITDNSFNFFGNVSGPPITTYSWNFGTDATPSQSTDLNVSNVVFNSPGQHAVQLTASFLQCSETATSTVFVFREPTIHFGMETGLQCAPYPAYFKDSSTADSPILYLWNFGDGTTSTLQHPTHIYSNPGQYVVSLQIITTEGCKDTLQLSRNDLINVHPTPVSAFAVTPQQTDICHSNITFIDHSQGGITTIYFFDDGNETISGHGPEYLYTTPGMHYPMQVVINEFGCSDSSMRSLFIEPFNVYIPNAFTPDGNEFNNTFFGVSALDAASWNLRVYDRWGELLFETDDQFTHWDGSFKGNICQSGVYTYILKYTSCAPNAAEELVTGHFSLLR